jgi:hypothetical protein
MKKKNLDLVDNIKEKLGSDIINIKDSFDMVTIEVSSEKLLRTCKILKDEKNKNNHIVDDYCFYSKL